MKNMIKVAAVCVPMLAGAAAPEGWQLVDGVYTPIQDAVSTYPVLNANESVFVGPGTNVTMSAAFALANAKQGTSSTFCGGTLTVVGNIKAYVKGNDSKVTFKGATVNSEGTLTMNDNAAASGDTEVRFINGTEATFANGIWWQTQCAAGTPVSAKVVVSNATLSIVSNRCNIQPSGTIKTDPGAVCDFAIEVQDGGVFNALGGITASGNANSHVLKVCRGGELTIGGNLQLSTVSGVNAEMVCESGSRVVQTGGAIIANAGAKLRFDLLGPASDEGTALYSKLTGDYAKFNEGFLGEINVSKEARGTYKLLEVMGHPTNAKNGISGFETFMNNVSSNVTATVSLRHWYVKEGTGTQTKYTWYAQVKSKGFVLFVR